MIDPEKPYPERVYNALKQKVNGFDLSPEDFYTKLNDPVYQTNVYNALKTKVQGFDVPETEFYDRLKKKDQTDSAPSSIAAPEEQKISTPPTFEGENLVPGTPQPLVNGNLPSGITEEQDKQNSLESLRQDWDKITGGDHRPMEDLANALPIDLKEKTFEQVSQEYDKQKKAEQGAKDYITGAEDKEVNPFVTFGKSVWNTLAYQLPSALAGTLAATGQSSMDHPSAEAMFPDFSKPKGAPGHRSQEQITNDTRSNMIDWAVKHGAKGEEITKDLVGTMDKIKDPIDALNWFSYALGQAAGQIPASVVSGGATSIGQEVGSIYLDGVKKIAQDSNLTVQQIIDKKLDHPAIAVAFGTASGLLDYIGAKNVLKVPKETLLKSLRRRALDIVKTGGTEAGTEYSQTWIEQIGKGQAAGNDLGKSWEEANTNEAARERLESAAQGFVGGAGAHVVSTMSTKPQENASNIESTAPVGEQPLGTQSTGGVGSEGVGPSQQGTETTGTSEPESKVPATEEKAQVTEQAPKEPVKEEAKVEPKVVEKPKPKKVKKKSVPEAKPVDKTIVAKEIEEQIGKANSEYTTADEAFKSKAKELDTALTKDQENLFGERDSQKDQGMFDIRANPEERDKILQPFKTRVEKAKENLDYLNQKLKEETGKKDTTLFDEEVGQIEDAHEVAKQYDEEARNPKVDAKDISIADVLSSTKISQESVTRYGDKKAVGQSMAKSYIRGNGQGMDNIARSANEHLTGNPEGPITEEDVWNFMQKYPNGASTVSTPSGNPKLAALANRYSELTGTAINRKTARTIVERVGKKYAESPEHVKAIESRFSSFVTDEGKFNAVRAHEAFEKSPEWIKSTYDLTDEEFEEIKNDLNEKAKKQGTAVQESTESESTKGNGVTSESSSQTSQEEGHPEEEPDWVTGEPMSRMAHAQFTGHRADGRTAKQVDVASRKIGRRALDAINRRLLAKFPSIKGVITNKEKVIQAWNDYLTHGGGIFMSFANQNNKLTTEMQTKLDKAEKLSAIKVDPYEIWKRTGWFKYKDGKWRYELNSSESKVLVTDHHMASAFKETSPGNVEKMKIRSSYDIPLPKVFDFKELYTIDPEAKNITVSFYRGPGEGAFESTMGDHIFVNLEKFAPKQNESTSQIEDRRDQLRSTLIHELTHRLQYSGGLSVGVAPFHFLEQASKESGKSQNHKETQRIAFDHYFNQASELEARRAQERKDYNDWQRTHIEPFNRKELPEFYAQNTGEELPNGFIYGDNIYINPDLARMDTPIHEFGHLWWNIVKQRFPVLYAAGQRLVKDSAYHKEVLDNPAYSSLSDSMKLDEAIVQAIGEKGALYANKSAWNKFWSDLWSKIKQVLGIKANIDLGKMSLNDLVSMAGRELLTPGEIGHLSSLHMPETATMRLKEFKLPKDAWDDWNQRVQLETIVNNPKSPEWEKAIKSAASERASAFMRGVQDNTRPMLEIQHDIVNDFIAKQKEVIDNDKSLDKKQKNQAKSALDKNRHTISEKLIGDAKDVHGLMDLMSGKAEAEIKRMHNWLYGKATTEKGYGGVMEFLTKDTDLRGRERVDQDSFAARVQKEGLTLLDVGFYGYVMHAEERNAHKSKISEGETKHGSGMTDEEAKFFKEEIKKRGKEDVLEKFFREAHDKLVQEPLSFRLQEGIINDKDYHVLKNFYGQHYVPLNVEEFASKSGSTGGLSTGLWGTGIKKAQGSDQYRYWQRTNPMVQLIKNYEKTIADIETNKVYKSLLKLAKESPNEKVWDIIRPKVVVTPEVNPETGDIDYKVDRFNSAAEERAMMTESVRVRVNGKQVFVHLKDPELRSMFLDKKANKPSNRFLVDMIRTVNNIQTYQRLTYIGLNIDFPFSNIQRDFQDALVNLQQHEIPGISRKILTDVPQAMMAIMKEELGKSSDPNISMMRHYMEEMEAQGGMISWLDMGGTKEIRADVEKEIHRFQDLQKKFKPGEMLLTPTRKLMRAVVVYNKMMEGAIRLSTYANLREAGVSEHKAAKASKNVTVNFNKKGSWGNFINLLYLFGNAGIQGVTMFTTSVIKSRKVKAMVLGAILAQIAMRTLLDNLADDDDEIKKLLNENDHNKNWIFVWPHSKGKLITIPVSYNMKPYKAIADGLYDLKKGTKDVSEASLYILKNAINSLVPMTESHLYPTLTVPIVEPIQNESMFSGRMIAPEKKTIGQRDSELYWPRTSKPFVNLAKGMSNAIEGNDDILEVSPAVMEYEFDYLMGGMKSYYKLGENAIDVANGMPTDWNKIPVLRRNVLDLSTQDWRGTTKMREYFGAFQKKRITQDQFDTYLQLRKELVESGAINYKKYSPKLIIRLQFKDFNNPLYVDPKYTPKSKESEDDLY